MANKELHVIFGTGPLGLAVMRALSKRGHLVRMVNRSGKADVPEKINVVSADAYDINSVRRVTEGAVAVYQCAQPPYMDWTEKFPPLQTSILNGTADNGAKLIVAENLYMYGEVKGPIHEDLPYNAHTKKGKVRAAMARELIDAHNQGRIQVAMARGSDFYGKAVRGSTLGERVFIPMLKGKPAQVMGNVDLPHTYTFIDDFGAAMAILGERDEALGRAWHVPNPPTLTTRQIIELIAQEIGIEAKLSAMGGLMLRIGGLFIPEARESIEMLYQFTQPFVVDDSRFVKEFGNIATPHEDALHSTVRWYRQYLATT